MQRGSERGRGVSELIAVWTRGAPSLPATTRNQSARRPIHSISAPLHPLKPLKTHAHADTPSFRHRARTWGTGSASGSGRAAKLCGAEEAAAAAAFEAREAGLGITKAGGWPAAPPRMAPSCRKGQVRLLPPALGAAVLPPPRPSTKSRCSCSSAKKTRSGHMVLLVLVLLAWGPGCSVVVDLTEGIDRLRCVQCSVHDGGGGEGKEEAPAAAA
jgi:hypothetical protein